MAVNTDLSQTCCQIRKKSSTTGTKTSIIGIGCLVTLPTEGVVYQDRICILSRYLKIPQISLGRDCFVVFNKDKRIQLKPDRYLESSALLGFTLVACEQAKVLKDEQLKPFPLQFQRLFKGQTFVSIKPSSCINGYGLKDHIISQVCYSKLLFSSESRIQSLKVSTGAPLISDNGSSLIGITGSIPGTGVSVNAVIHQIRGFSESDGAEEILHQLDLLDQEELRLDKDQMKISACQILSKLAAKNSEDVEALVSHTGFTRVLLSLPGSEPNIGLLGAACKLLTVLTSLQTLTSQTRAISGDIVSYVLSAMSTSQHATVHLFGCRVLLNLITCHSTEGLETYNSDMGDLRTFILEKDGASVLKRVVRCHRDDKHIQHTVCVILGLLLEFTYRGWKESEDLRSECITELEAAQEHLSQVGDGLNSSKQSYEKVEAELAHRIEEQDKALRQQNQVIEKKESTIEQLHRRLEHSLIPSSTVNSSVLEEETQKLRESIEREREMWQSQQSELEASLDFSQELVRDMTSALRAVKCDLESEDGGGNRKNDYKSWNSIKDELDRMTRAVELLGETAEQQLTYHYDMMDVGLDEDKQLQNNMESGISPSQKDEVLRRFERTHSQTSLDISMNTEQKATKTLDKLQMVRRAIHCLEQGLEEEEEKLEKLRQTRFINPLRDIIESDAPTTETDIDVHNLPRGLLKNLCRMLDEAPACAWRSIVPLLGMGHRIKDIETSLDSPTAELIRIWTNENRLAQFSDLMEVLRLAEEEDVVIFINRHLQLKKRLSKQSFIFFPLEQPSSSETAS